MDDFKILNDMDAGPVLTELEEKDLLISILYEQLEQAEDWAAIYRAEAQVLKEQLAASRNQGHTRG